MLDAATRSVHTDINAIITDDDGVLDEDCTTAPPSSTCGQPFREFTVIFHDEIKDRAGFPELDQPSCIHGVRDGFAINYGASGLGAMFVANRKKVGPTKDCNECKFEEFFLESWADGDPAMIVKKDCYGQGHRGALPGRSFKRPPLIPGRPRALPQHSRRRKETHVFHLHAHQWLQSPRDENSTYLDSQTISPGAAFTYEINYGGSGNRNFTVGDSIFHCHLYPHFAQGMWELWRDHDVFEAGTADRNLPDAEIAGGTPNPAVVPIPNGDAADAERMFGATAFYIAARPAIARRSRQGLPVLHRRQARTAACRATAHRPPQAPNDIERDGGLPRHRIALLPYDGRRQSSLHCSTTRSPRACSLRTTTRTCLPSRASLTTANIELLPTERQRRREEGDGLPRRALGGTNCHNSV